MSRHRAQVRPRYGRIATLAGSVVVVLVATLGGIGALPSGSAQDDRAVDPAASAEPAAAPATEPTAEPKNEPTQESSEQSVRRQRSGAAEPEQGLVPIAPGADSALDEALPADSGEGYRVVFSESRQRVWLVAEGGAVRRTYLVSGSIYDNLDPGTYEVYSRSEDAIGIDDSGTMEWFVRFTQGPSGAAIGFHSIPVDDQGPVQTIAQLGTPLSHGCIRQDEADALALWDFAPIGTTVVVTA
ncbi:L,D-transpeptidase [Nocardioides nanhaiensis]|uniref:L,D-TPase catalytic domain-containing protein n=1 Tax=Nocardioides nanhaiensis TaxID=1476871 RepID=A0ABP8W003_9ACTN